MKALGPDCPYLSPMLNLMGIKLLHYKMLEASWNVLSTATPVEGTQILQLEGTYKYRGGQTNTTSIGAEGVQHLT